MSNLDISDLQNFNNSNFQTIDSAIARNLIDGNYVSEVIQTVKKYWNIISQTVDENNLVEPSIVFTHNKDLQSILGDEGDMDLCYFFPSTNSIYFNIDFKNSNPVIPNAALYNTLSQVMSSMLANEQMVSGEIVSSIHGISYPTLTDEEITQVYENSGKAFYLSLPETEEVDALARDTQEVFPYEAHKYRELLDFTLCVLIALKGKELFGVDMYRVKIEGKEPRAKDTLEIDLLSYDQDRLIIWLKMIFKYIKFGDAIRKEFNEFLSKDKEFKRCIVSFLDRSGIEKKTFKALQTLMDKESTTLKDKKDYEALYESQVYFYDLTVVLNDNTLTNKNPVLDLIRDVGIKVGYLKLHFLVVPRGHLNLPEQ